MAELYYLTKHEVYLSSATHCQVKIGILKACVEEIEYVVPDRHFSVLKYYFVYRDHMDQMTN